jgi:DNA-binding transcriptional LysR family regulator
VERVSDVEVFVRVVETGSFARAAAQLGASRSFVSRMMAGLEARLGVRLLHRTTRRVAATVSGQAFYERAAPLVHGIAAAEASARAEVTTPQGTLRVSLPHAFGSRWLVGPLLAFQDAHPSVRLEVHFDDRKVDLLDGNYDVAVRGGASLDGPWVARALWRFSLVVVASPAYLARGGVPVHPRVLAAHPGLLYAGSAHPGTWTFGKDGERLNVAVEGRLTFDAPAALADAALRGAGVALLPDWVICDDVRSGRLVRLFPDWEGPGAAFWFVRPDRVAVPARVLAFQEHLSGLFSPAPWGL